MKQAILMISLVMIVAVLPIFSRQNIVREKSVTRDELLHFTAEWGKPEELGELPNNPSCRVFMPILKSCILIRQRSTTFILPQTVSLDGAAGILLFFRPST